MAVTLELLLVIGTFLACTVNCEQESPMLPYTYPAPEDRVANTTSLYFGLMQSFGGTYDGSGSIPGVQLALDTINQAQTILPGYTLHFVLRDSFCEHTTALESLHRLLFEDPVKIAMMGSGCSPATEPTAEIDHYYNLTHISCVSSSILLSNRTRYRAYFQMLPSEADIAEVIYGAISNYGWQNIAIITQNENILTLTTATLIEKLTAANISSTERTFETKTGISILYNNGDLFEPNARIFFIATFSSHARDIICAAYRQGFNYPRYMFLTYAWYSPQWWDEEGSQEFNCTSEERLSVLNLTLAFLHFPFVRFGDVDASTDVELTGSTYMEEVQGYANKTAPLFLDRVIEGAGFCHDATWTLAFALNRTLEELMTDDNITEKARNASNSSNPDFSLEDFDYGNFVIQQIMLRHLTSTNFTGVTGDVKFQEGIRDVDDLRVLQIKLNSTANGYGWDKIATVTITDDNTTNVTFIYVDSVSDDNVFPYGVPYDGLPREVDVTIHLSLTIVISIFVAVGLAFTVVCLVFNTIFRDKKLIRLSSPNLNYIICIGAIILYWDMILLVIPSTDQHVVTYLCNLNPWFTAIGYSFCYGTILVKMFRVYYIYSNPSPRKKNTLIIKDKVLILMVLGMVAVDFLILSLYFIIEGYRGNLEATRVRNAENEFDVEGLRQITTVYYTYICNSNGRLIFLGILYGYKLLLQFLSLFLAFATRRVKVKGLNDTKEVAGAVYVTSITFSVLYVSSYSVVRYINVYATIFCLALFIGTSTILALLFIPKMVSLYKDPEGLTVFRGDLTGVHGTTKPNTDQSTIESLRRRIRELETMVSQNSPRPPSAASAQHLVPPSQRGGSRLSDISFDGDEREHRTIWDNGSMVGDVSTDFNGTHKDSVL